MDEAASKKRRIFFRRLLKSRSGQALVEYVLILTVALLFAKVFYFNSNFGIKASLDKTMLRLGAHLEQDLKSGTKLGGNGEDSSDAFAGTAAWSN